jgi:hypothetical protein
MKKTTLLRKMLLDPEMVIMPEVYDPPSASIIKQIWFKAIRLGGAARPICSLGKPDMGIVGWTNEPLVIFTGSGGQHGNGYSKQSVRDNRYEGSVGCIMKNCGLRFGM